MVVVGFVGVGEGVLLLVVVSDMCMCVVWKDSQKGTQRKEIG